MTLSQIAEYILKSKKIGITYHVSPDGDAVGSVLALINGLKSLNSNIEVLICIKCGNRLERKVDTKLLKNN